MHIPEDILALIEKYKAGTISKDELQLLNKWYHSFNDVEAEIDMAGDEQAMAELIKQRLLQTISRQKKPRIRRRWMISAAAAVLILISASVYFILSTNNWKPEIVKSPVISPQPVNDILPGGNKALLTLADGSTIILDSAANGTLTMQGAIKVEKLDNGLLVYNINGKQLTENDAAFYNTITTPRGGQYQVTLSDGTKVWLNAASSLRYPVAFTGAERNVEITGEAYFEVAKNAAMPFKVKAATSVVEVLGTHFNVNAYDDEASIKTTLLEGSVKVSVPASAGNQSPKFLKPGQQSGINKEGKISVLNNADTEEVMAWKNGRFQFKSSDLKTILRQISRWYDVDVQYNGNVALHFTGQLPRSSNASKVFEKLEMTGVVHFKIDGKRIIVSH